MGIAAGEFGSCCKDLKDAMTIPPQKFLGKTTGCFI